MADWQKDVRDSLYVHELLPLHRERSLENEFPGKHVLRFVEWTDTPVSGLLSPGAIVPNAEGFELRAPVRVPCWPQGVAQDGDYANWGQADACLARGGADWSGMNRLRFEVYPSQSGAGHSVLNAAIIMETADAYAREGETTFNLEPGRWQTCYYEFPELDMSKARMIRLYALLNGSDTVMGGEVCFAFRRIVLEEVEQTEPYHGWACDRIIVPLTGYFLRGAKTAVAPWLEHPGFTVTDQDGAVLYEGEAARIVNEKGLFARLDFSALDKVGDYELVFISV